MGQRKLIFYTLIVYEQMTVKFNYSYYIAILRTYNCVQIEQLVFDSNTWNYLTLSKQMSPDSFKNCYLETIRLQILSKYI